MFRNVWETIGGMLVVALVIAIGCPLMYVLTWYLIQVWKLMLQNMGVL